MENLQIVYLDPKDLTPYGNNARAHAKKDIDAIRASIREFGFSDPIGIWSDQNYIVEGHGRRLAAIAEGLDSVPCIRLDHMTDEQRKAYALAHNKTAELSEWNFGILDLELAGIQEIDMSAFGFEPIPEPEPEVAEDEIPEEVQTRCKPGDLWKLGNHRLICGDSTDVNVIDRLMDGVKAKLLLTDPPYGIDYGGMLKGKGDGKGGADKNGWKSYDAPTWDIERPDESVFSYIITLAEESIIWGGNYFADILPPKMCWLVWDKGQRDFSLADGELAWTSFDKALRIKTYSRASANREEKVHPTDRKSTRLNSSHL